MYKRSAFSFPRAENVNENPFGLITVPSLVSSGPFSASAMSVIRMITCINSNILHFLKCEKSTFREPLLVGLVMSQDTSISGSNGSLQK